MMTNDFQPSQNLSSTRSWSAAATPANDSGEVDLNEVLKTVLKKLQPHRDRTPAILKCDKLPHVRGSEGELIALFGEMLDMIFNHPPPNSKILLYIQCTKETVGEDIMDLSNAGEPTYTIFFHTNICTSETWMQLNKARLESCHLLSSKVSGMLTHYNISNTGCLFSLKLPGKIF